MITLKRETRQQTQVTAAHRDYEKGLSAHAFFRIHDKIICQDLVQDTFTKTWAYLVRGGKIVLMKAFLYHVLNDLIIDEYRKNKPKSLNALIEKGFEPRTDDFERLFDVLDGKNALQLIQKLPPKYRRALRMRYVDELNLKEISFITGQSKNTTAVQIHRGLQKLKLLYDRTE